jgi:hypothetical protein
MARDAARLQHQRQRQTADASSYYHHLHSDAPYPDRSSTDLAALIYTIGIRRTAAQLEHYWVATLRA